MLGRPTKRRADICQRQSSACQWDEIRSSPSPELELLACIDTSAPQSMGGYRSHAARAQPMRPRLERCSTPDGMSEVRHHSKETIRCSEKLWVHVVSGITKKNSLTLHSNLRSGGRSSPRPSQPPRPCTGNAAPRSPAHLLLPLAVAVRYRSRHHATGALRSLSPASGLLPISVQQVKVLSLAHRLGVRFGRPSWTSWDGLSAVLWVSLRAAQRGPRLQQDPSPPACVSVCTAPTGGGRAGMLQERRPSVPMCDLTRPRPTAHLSFTYPPADHTGTPPLLSCTVPCHSPSFSCLVPVLCHSRSRHHVLGAGHWCFCFCAVAR